MAGENDPVRLAIVAKIVAWTTVLESYDAAVSGDGPAGEPGTVVNAVGSAAGSSRMAAYSQSDLPVGIFRAKGLKEAIPIYLAAGRRKQSNKEITTGLQAGGFPTTAENFEATVATALYRLKNEGIVLRFPDGWDLASSYPESLRSRLEKDAKPRRTSGSKPSKPTKRRKPSSGANAKTSVAAKLPRRRRTTANGPSIDQQILKVLIVEGPNSPAAFVARLVKPANVVGLALGRLAKLGKAKKLPNGNFAAITTESVLRAV